jgi:hypothetical protein
MKSITKSRYIVIWFAVFFLIMSLSATLVSAGEKVKLEGKIQGIKCTHYKVECVNRDEFIDMETDFVLVMPNGEYYFIPNLSRSVKARHAYNRVVVQGERTGQEIWVDSLDDLDRKKNGKSKSKRSWDWSRKDEFWESR